MRCFIAVDIGDDVAVNIGGLQDEIRGVLGEKVRGVKWVDPGLIHLTLKFLGEVGDDEIVEVCRIAGEVASEFERFSVEVKKVGSFGRPPRVVWIGTEENDTLGQLQRSLDTQLAEMGFEADEKKFIAHLTLCRVKNPMDGKHLKRIISGFDDYSAGKIDVKAICVYKSELTNTGPEYTLLSRNELA